VALPPQGPLEV